MGLRDTLKRLERARREEQIVIPQMDGTIKRFPKREVREAYSNLMDRLGAADEAPPEHPLLTAARNSSDPTWRESSYSVDAEDWVEQVEDLFD